MLIGIDFGPFSPGANVTSIVLGVKSPSPAVPGLAVTLKRSIYFYYEQHFNSTLQGDMQRKISIYQFQ